MTMDIYRGLQNCRHIAARYGDGQPPCWPVAFSWLVPMFSSHATDCEGVWPPNIRGLKGHMFDFVGARHAQVSRTLPPLCVSSSLAGMGADLIKLLEVNVLIQVASLTGHFPL